MKFVLLFTFACIFGLSQAYWANCPNVPGLDLFQSPNCSGDRCRAIRGETFYAWLLLTTPEVYEELRIVATAFIFGIGINLPISPPFDDGCNLILYPNGTNANCPTAANQQYGSEIAMHISPIFPAMQNTRVQIDYWNGTNRVICLQILAVDLL